MEKKHNWKITAIGFIIFAFVLALMILGFAWNSRVTAKEFKENSEVTEVGISDLLWTELETHLKLRENFEMSEPMTIHICDREKCVGFIPTEETLEEFD